MISFIIYSSHGGTRVACLSHMKQVLGQLIHSGSEVVMYILSFMFAVVNSILNVFLAVFRVKEHTSLVLYKECVVMILYTCSAFMDESDCPCM